MKWTKFSEKLPNVGDPVLIKFYTRHVYDPKKNWYSPYTEYMVGKLDSGTSIKDSEWTLSDLEYNYDPETYFDSWLCIKDIEASCN